MELILGPNSNLCDFLWGNDFIACSVAVIVTVHGYIRTDEQFAG